MFVAKIGYLEITMMQCSAVVCETGPRFIVVFTLAHGFTLIRIYDICRLDV